MIKRPQLFFGWVIVGVAILCTTVLYGTRHSFSVFFSYILDEFGWSRGSTAIMFSLNIFVYGLFAPIAGGLADRWDPKRLMLIGAILLGLTTAGCGLAQELWHFYVLFGILMPIGSAFSGWPLFAPALANWFTKKRGLAIGLGQTGGGISFVYAIFAEFTIFHVGWRCAYFLLGGILIVLLVPLYWLFFSYRPEDRNLKAYGASDQSSAECLAGAKGIPETSLSRNWTLGDAMRTYQLWLLVLAMFLYWGVGNYLVLAHQVRFAEDLGFSKPFATSIFALFGLFMVVGQLSASISDILGREKTITLAAVLNISALVALTSVSDTSQPWLLYFFAICFGCGVGLFSPTIVAGAADLFHGGHFGAIAGLLLTGMGVGGVIGPWLGGYLFDISGTYTYAFILCMACSCLACTAFWIAAPRNPSKLRAGV